MIVAHGSAVGVSGHGAGVRPATPRGRRNCWCCADL